MDWQVSLAFGIAEKAHKGQFDRAGAPYINHPIKVAEMVQSDKAKAVAYLHDVIEDTDMDIADISGYGFDGDVISALMALTHDSRMPYQNYILGLKDSNLAREVKIADLRHNMDLTRLKKITKKDVLRQQKYLRALAVLMEVDLDGDQ